MVRVGRARDGFGPECSGLLGRRLGADLREIAAGSRERRCIREIGIRPKLRLRLVGRGLAPNERCRNPDRIAVPGQPLVRDRVAMRDKDEGDDQRIVRSPITACFLGHAIPLSKRQDR